jgi:hypothetical protein
MSFGVVASSSRGVRPPVRTSRDVRKRRHVRATRATVTEKQQSVGEIDEIVLAGKLKGASGVGVLAKPLAVVALVPSLG